MCLYPRTLSNTIIPITVDCGYCPECINKRRDAWSFRLFHEQQSSFLTLFTFLSYDDDNLPIMDGYPVLNWSDITLYLKRVRKELATLDVKLTYFIAGEYGPRTLRPHYHSLFFFHRDTPLTDFRDTAFFINVLRKHWNKGFINSEVPCSDGVSGYCSKYIMKNISNLYQFYKHTYSYYYKDAKYADLKHSLLTSTSLSETSVQKVLETTLDIPHQMHKLEFYNTISAQLFPDESQREQFLFQIQHSPESSRKSQGLGISYYEQNSDLLKSKLDFSKTHSTPFVVRTMNKPIAVPRYYKRKITGDTKLSDDELCELKRSLTLAETQHMSLLLDQYKERYHGPLSFNDWLRTNHSDLLYDFYTRHFKKQHD